MTAPHDDLDARVRAHLAALDGAPDRSMLPMFDAMAASRLVDIEARRRREKGQGFYTIGSAGHESNAFVAAALRPSDPALLHYRSGGFYVARSLQAGRSVEDGIRDILLGMFAASADPSSGGRHKVFGHPGLAVIPQTSTIASHLPRAVGVAFAIGRARKLGRATRWPADALAVCSFGDASLNHSTAVGALNTASYTVHQGLPLPLLLVCEDNGLGISVPTPAGWVASAAQRPGIRYFHAAGDDPDDLAATAREAAAFVRDERRPAFLHLRTVRFLSHAGSDVESAYRSPAEIDADLSGDPLVAVARRIGGGDLLERYENLAGLVRTLADEAAEAPRLTSAAAVMRPLGTAAGETAGPAGEQEMTLAQAINGTLAEALATDPGTCVFGEDVARKGGVYGVTRGLQQRFGAARVFDTLLDEQAILGLGLGLGVSGLLPLPEIQYLAYLHNAEDQIRGEAASLRFFSDGAFTNPMVVRIAGLAYQKGFGGHFHNDNGLAVLRDIPGLVVGIPARPDDAVGMLRSTLAAARADGQVSVLVEPIALYHERDLHAPGDRGWLAKAPAGGVPIGSARVYGDGTALTIVTFGNGLRMSLRVARRLGPHVRVVDLRWISPLPDLLPLVAGPVLIADETRLSGGVGEGVVAKLVAAGFRERIVRVAARDSFIPLGDAANLVLLGEDDIERAARELLS